jgi:hypothetical protein
VDLFCTIHTTLKSEAVLLNMKDLIIALNLLIQIAPAALWGEAMHTSGLFAYLLRELIDGEAGVFVAFFPCTKLIFLLDY